MRLLSVCVVAVLLLKEIVLCAWIGFLFPVPVWFSTVCACFVCDLIYCLVRVVFLSVILYLMCSGKSLHALCLLECEVCLLVELC